MEKIIVALADSDNLAREIKEYKDEISKSEKKKLILQSEISNLEGRIESLKTEIDLAYKSRLEEIESNLEIAKEKENECERRRGDLLRDRDKFESERDEKLAAIQNLGNEWKEKIEEVEAKDARLGELQKRLSDREETLKGKEADFEKRNKALSESERIFEKSQIEIDTQRENLTQAFKALDEKSASLEIVEKEIASSKKTILAGIEKLDQSKSEHESELKSFDKKKEDFNSEKEALAKEREKLLGISEGLKQQEDNIAKRESDLNLGYRLLEKRKKEVDERAKVVNELKEK